MSIRKNNKIIVILGPTASGKTSLAVDLAREFDGEVVGADSRQVYKWMDVGTGKDLGEYEEISHHLIDVVHPNDEFDVAEYQKKVYRAFDDILERGKMPILAGGTGMYLQAVVDGYVFEGGTEDKRSREKLENMTKEKLQSKLKALNPEFFSRLNNSEKNNKLRLARMIEVISQKGERRSKKRDPGYDFLIFGVSCPPEKLDEKIYKRLKERLEKEGMIEEVEMLHNEKGVSWEKLYSFGLEYRFITEYLTERLDYDDMVDKLERSIKKFSRRQMTWFRRWEKQGVCINWIEDKEEAKRLTREFLGSGGLK